MREALREEPPDGAIRRIAGAELAGLAEAVLKEGIPFRFHARGRSMWPMIRDGDVLTIAPRTPAAFRRGDVVAFVHPKGGRLMVHRIVDRDGQRFLLRGDHAARPDGWIAENRILGKVTSVERGEQRVRAGLGTERCLIALLQRHPAARRLAGRLYRRLGAPA